MKQLKKKNGSKKSQTTQSVLCLKQLLNVTSAADLQNCHLSVKKLITADREIDEKV